MPLPLPLPNSGKQQQFDSGAVRDTHEGKGRYDLIPAGALKAVAIRYQQGAEAYGERNWEKGMPVGRLIDSAIRHLYAHLSGCRKEDHLSAAAWNALGAHEMQSREDARNTEKPS